MKSPKYLYLIRLWIEMIGFWFLNLLLFPVRIRLQTSRPSESFLTYEDLCNINKQFKTFSKLTTEQEIMIQNKWSGRVSQIADIFNKTNILEVGCGNGFAALSLIKPGRNISAVDIVDIRADKVKQSEISFSIGDVCNRLPYEDNTFDLIFSINSFEHFEQPDLAFIEMIRVLAPNGLLFLAFSPLYYSPWGLHASRRLGMPYPQLLFSPSTIQQFVDLNKNVIADTYSDFADRMKIGPYLNKYSLGQYRQIFNSQIQQIKTLAKVEAISFDGMKIIFQYPGVIKTKAPSPDDLFVSGYKFLARKRAVE
jgi:ubiquinone/menaquinone biosynthesis C-methylase UbiE